MAANPHTIAASMPTRIETDVSVQRFGFVSDETGNRLLFPHAHTHKLEGRSGTVGYGVDDCMFERLEGRLGALLWAADTASFGNAWLRDDAGRFDIAVDRIEMPSGIQLTRAQSGVEIIAPHVSLSEMRLTVNGPFGRSASDKPAPPKSTGAPTLRQDRLRFLDSLSGRIYLTVKVVLDLPVLGKRTLDQALKIAIQEGQIDFRALEDSLDWLEGRFIDIEADGDRLVLSFRVPIFGSTRELISWQLDSDAATVSSFGKVPVRSLADYRTKRGSGGTKDKSDDKHKRKILQSLAIEGIDIAIGLLAPRSLEVGNGLIMFGGDDQPGMVDLKVAGSIRDAGPGQLTGAIGSVDTTIKDLRLGPILLSADRLHFDKLDGLDVTFDGFRPAKITMVVSRVTATNLAMRVGGER
jgi:hypothetical protein